MRIIIEIDGSHVTATTVNTPGAPGVPLEAVSTTPPADVLKAAAKLGALNAGPAPVRLGGPAAMAAPVLPPSGLETVAPAPTNVDAGRAPEGPEVSAWKGRAQKQQRRGMETHKRKR